nr:LLM class F420-dependent oxidoreductase [Amycolatopsis acidicola]
MATPACGQLARHAEELGYSSLWTGEHSVLPRPRRDKPPLEPDWPMADPLVTLAYIAASTTHMQLCTGVVVLPQHNPVQLAKRVATLDVLSGGRLVLGVGIGHVSIEFAALGVPMQGRRERAREYLAAMRALWAEEPPVFSGRYVSFAGVDAYPKPVSRLGPAVVLGGVGERALRDAARLGQGWYGFGQTPDEVRVIAATLHRLLAEEERDLASFRISVTPRARLTPALADDYRSAGVHQLVVSVEADSVDGVRRKLDRNAPGRLGID